MQQLPELLSGQLADGSTLRQDVEIREPLSVQFRLTRSELLNFIGASSPGSDWRTGKTQVLQQRFAEAFGQCVLPVLEAAVAAAVRDDETENTKPPRAGQDERDRTSIGPLLRLLLDWHERGKLESLLDDLAEPTLKAWHEMLMATNEAAGLRRRSNRKRRQANESDTDEAAHLESIDEIIHRELSPTPGNQHVLGVMRCRIVAAVLLADQLGRAPSEASIQAVLDRHFPILQRPTQRHEDTASIAAVQVSGGSDGKAADRSHDAVVASHKLPGPTAAQRTATHDVHIASVLPFLLLGPLSKIGYLDAVDAALHAAGMADRINVFATALAFKTLPAPLRGWHRDEASRSCAAAFAGVVEAVDDSELADLARGADQFVSALDSVVARAVLNGHDPEQPLLLTKVEARGDRRLLLSDVDGAFPICCVESSEALLEMLRSCDSMLILIDRSVATTSLLRSLQRNGLRFLIDVPPTRDESWRMIRGRNRQRWWTNDLDRSPAKLARQGAELATAAESVANFSRALMIERSAIPLAQQQLDDAISLAAGVGLGQIAWTLWHERETTDPLLALDRFADLDAHIHFRDDQVRVVLPLGRRSIDLSDHGLLDDVPSIAWLGCRPVTFSKG